MIIVFVSSELKSPFLSKVYDYWISMKIYEESFEYIFLVSLFIRRYAKNSFGKVMFFSPLMLFIIWVQKSD